MSTITIFHTEKIRDYSKGEYHILLHISIFLGKMVAIFRTHRFNSSRQRGASFLLAKWQVVPSYIARCF